MSGLIRAGFNNGKANNVEVNQQARVVFNAKPDKRLIVKQQRIADYAETDNLSVHRLYPAAPLSNKYHKIETGDMLFSFNNGSAYNVNRIEGRNKMGGNRKKSGMNARNKAEPLVVTNPGGACLNLESFGLTLNDSDLLKRRIARNLFKFVGISDTEYDIDTTNTELQKTGIAVQRGGVTNTYNTGVENIKAFQKVMWDLPDWNHRSIMQGVETKSLKFAVVPVDPYQAATYEALISSKEPEKREKELMNKGMIPTNIGELKHCANQLGLNIKSNEFKKFFFGLSFLLHEQDDRIFGTALESAGPGEEYAVLLNSHF